tara:strand:- start:76 stop:630 length:555 start_codon:yes stop_codon:yes gene_type:complete
VNDYPYYKKSINDLIPYANNSRTHSDEQVNQIASSIKEFGFTNPVLIDEQGGLIAGHGRVMAAKKLNLDEVPSIELKGLTEAQKKAYIIADNQLPLNAGWDFDMLKLELEALNEMEFDIDLLGFDDEFMNDLFETVDDEVEPELKEDDYCEKFNVIVECNNENQQEIVYAKLQAEGYVCQVQSL